jgi:uncharacterized protein (TIGR03083 family)
MSAEQRVHEIVPITFDTDAREVATRAYEALINQLTSLDEMDWSAPTECAPWTVADMVGHMIGAARAGASFRELMRQQMWGYRHRKDFDGNELDAVNQLQVRERTGLSVPERLRCLQEVAPRAVEGRMRLPRFLRGLRLPNAKGGSTADGMPGSLTLGHVMSTIYTRDVWLHRVDIARATGSPLVTEPRLDDRVIADVVLEWAGRHEQPFRLELSGPGAGTFSAGDGGPHLRYDTVEFCRVLSGRAPAEGLLSTRVLF